MDTRSLARYEVTTSNINLPIFFKKSRWPKVRSNVGNWIGYVAVSTDKTTNHFGRRDVAIAWRGTVTRLEWIADLMDFLKLISGDKIPCPDPTARVESGFLDLYTGKEENCGFCKYSAREQILAEVKRLTEMHADEETSITLTGHSSGSALAMLSEPILWKQVYMLCKIVGHCLFRCSGPRVGNARFKERIESFGFEVLRVVVLKGNDVMIKNLQSA